MAKNLTVRLDDELAADAEALARAEVNSLNETADRNRTDRLIQCRALQRGRLKRC